MTPLRQIRWLLAYQVAVGAAGTMIFGLSAGRERAASFAAGATLALFGVGLLAWAGWRVFAQKSVARTVAIIISKYAILLTSIFYLTRAPWFDTVTGGLGIASFILPALGLAVFNRESETPRG